MILKLINHFQGLKPALPLNFASGIINLTAINRIQAKEQLMDEQYLSYREELLSLEQQYWRAYLAQFPDDCDLVKEFSSQSYLH